MSKQTDTERAIEILEYNQPYMKGDANEWVYALAITSLRSQSESEQKIEKVRACCDTNINRYAYSDVDDFSMGEMRGKDELAKEILEILDDNVKV